MSILDRRVQYEFVAGASPPYQISRDPNVTNIWPWTPNHHEFDYVDLQGQRCYCTPLGKKVGILTMPMIEIPRDASFVPETNPVGCCLLILGL